MFGKKIVLYGANIRTLESLFRKRLCHFRDLVRHISFGESRTIMDAIILESEVFHEITVSQPENLVVVQLQRLTLLNTLGAFSKLGK